MSSGLCTNCRHRLTGSLSTGKVEKGQQQPVKSSKVSNVALKSDSCSTVRSTDE